MLISDIIAIVGIVVPVLIALIGGARSIITSTKRFELAEEYKRELFSWCREVMFAIAKLESGVSGTERDAALAEFSALIDIGRFYFPNDTNNNTGRHKTLIQRGRRQLPLEFLVLIYEIARTGHMEQEKKTALQLKYEYLSVIFQVVAPEERIRYIDRHTDYKSIPKEGVYDYLARQGLSDHMISVVKKYHR